MHRAEADYPPGLPGLSKGTSPPVGRPLLRACNPPVKATRIALWPPPPPQPQRPLLEIDGALASLAVLYDYCEEHSLHHTPLRALYAATTAIEGPHARLKLLLDPDTPNAEGGANG